MKTYDFSSLLLIAAHYCSFSRFFLSSQHNFTCPGGKKKISILLSPRNKVRHGLVWWCTCIRTAFKPKILGQGVFGNDWEKREIQIFRFFAIFTCTGEKKFSILFLPRHKIFKRFDLVIYMPKKRFLAKIWGRGVVFSKIEKMIFFFSHYEIFTCWVFELFF